MCSINYLYLVTFEYTKNIQNAFTNLYFYCSSRLREGAAQVRWYEVLPPMGMLRGGTPAPAFTAPMNPQSNKFHWFLEIYFR